MGVTLEQMILGRGEQALILLRGSTVRAWVPTQVRLVQSNGRKRLRVKGGVVPAQGNRI